MSAPTVLIAAWARSAVVPHGGAFGLLHAHEMAAPVVQAMLARAGIRPQAVDAVLVGNALGAGGNPARMVALAASLPERCAALSVDTQCCSGLDAVSMGAALIASGQAHVVVAGGVEAWSRSPMRFTRPIQPGEAPVPYERPPFAPDPAHDPDLLLSAARYAAQHGNTREQQDAYAVLSHQRAVAHQAELAHDIVAVAGVRHDLYPRTINATRAARMPIAAQTDALDALTLVGIASDCSISRLGISAKADGAAFVVLVSAQACGQLGLQPAAAWISSASVGGTPDTPLLAAQHAAAEALQRAGIPSCEALSAVELHDAFAVQGLSFCRALGLDPQRINPRGGGLARGHPIGASGAIALVQLLANLALDAPAGGQGLVAVAGAGGIGAAAVVERL
ncbi:thiolase family protein [Limnohabitans sp. JirII-31]|uniref:thiolase family protein n=1 Tax=Limnohabitans sp. JirII-31 TaxID=1977908 RepID=UPI000C1E0DC2|nr:thiolase family protein [Limnohabitans sp. JirII-31]PIT79720.1 acetyl-CoA acetyltransferase [Limnohabitans sp. JirII-31]